MPSKRKPSAGTGRSEDAVVEMDPAFARNVGLGEGSKVGSVCSFRGRMGGWEDGRIGWDGIRYLELGFS